MPRPMPGEAAAKSPPKETRPCLRGHAPRWPREEPACPPPPEAAAGGSMRRRPFSDRPDVVPQRARDAIDVMDEVGGRLRASPDFLKLGAVFRDLRKVPSKSERDGALACRVVF